MTEQRTFVTLDGLRGVAALTVVTRHAPAFFATISVYVPENGETVPVGPFFESYLAVDFFFVLSGFVLAYAYGARLCEGMSARTFLTMRLIRLYPLYLIGLIVSLCIAERHWAWGDMSGITLLVNTAFALVLLPSPMSPGSLFPLNVPAWSLFNELVANAIFGLFGKQLRIPLLLSIVILAGLGLLGGVTQNWLGFENGGIGAMDYGFRWQSMGAGVARVLYSFFAGVLVFRAWSAWRPRWNVPPWILVLVLAAVLVANPSVTWQMAFDLVVTLVLFPCLVYLGAGSPARGLLATCFAWVGTASYAVYILQAPLYELTSLAREKIAQIAGVTLSQPSWVWGVGFIAMTFIVAICCDAYIDRPVRRVAIELILKSRRRAFAAEGAELYDGGQALTSTQANGVRQASDG